jgi:hypothetical protein
VIELYAITDAPGPSVANLAPLRVLAAGPLAIVYGPQGEDEATADALWRHEEAVESLMEEHDVLPVRYGTRCEDEAAASRAIEGREAELAAMLDRVRGAVELSVRVITTAPHEAPPLHHVDGAAYLAAKDREAAQSHSAADEVHAPLSALARASRRRAGSEPAELLRCASLVDRDAIDRFSSAVAKLQTRHDALRLLCTGPWPPYSFAER